MNNFVVSKTSRFLKMKIMHFVIKLFHQNKSEPRQQRLFMVAEK